MGRRERPPSLSERINAMERRSQQSGPTHCWVSDATGVQHPGLLLEWRKQGEAWAGLVSYVLADETGGFSLVQEWVSSEALSPLQ